MTGENRRRNAEAELARSAESLAAARLLLSAGFLHDAESRLYYAVYHAATALLVAESLQARTHAGVANLLGQHFVRTGRLDSGDGRLFVRMQRYRLEADYSVEFVLTADAVAEDRAACEGFVDRARALVTAALADLEPDAG